MFDYKFEKVCFQIWIKLNIYTLHSNSISTNPNPTNPNNQIEPTNICQSIYFNLIRMVFELTTFDY